MKTEIKWGLIFTVVALLWVTLEKLAGLHDQHIAWHPIITLLFFFPAVAMYVLALREKRASLGGRISYKQAFTSGLIISLIVMALSPLSQWITQRLIAPNYFKNMIEYSVSTGKVTLEQAQSNFNLPSYIMQAAIGALVAGVLTSLVVAAFVRTKNA